MGITPLNFTGFSDFSDSFQIILERTFTVANLPKTNLETEKTVLAGRELELVALRSDLQSLQGLFSSLGLSVAQGAASTSTSDAEVAFLTATGSVSPADFDVVVTSAAEAAQEATVGGLVDSNETALAADGVFKLTLGTTETSFDLLTVGSGRTAGTNGSSTPDPPVSIDVDFSGNESLDGISISAELESFFVAAAAPSTVGAGDTVSVSFTSTDSSISETVVTAALAGGEDASTLATALNDAITANAELNGKVSFSDEGGSLKLVVADGAATGFTFTSESTGTTVSGLESGGTVGGHSAEEIAAALNAQVDGNASLSAAGVQFTAVSGEVRIEGDEAFTATFADNAQGTGFASGLAGAQSVAGFDNTLAGLRDALNAGDYGVSAAIINTSSDLLNPSFHLTITADDTGSTTLTLEDSGDQNLLTSVNQGANADFTVNGLAASNSSNTITGFAPGLSLTIAGAGEAAVRAQEDTGLISDQLEAIATQYNVVAGRLQSHIGENAGVLSGDILVRQAQQTLRDITGYFADSGSVTSATALGFELGQDGTLSFNTSAFNTAADADFEDVKDFLGTGSSGFLGSSFDRLKELADPVTGQIETALSFLNQSQEQLTAQIEIITERTDQIIANLELQFAAADQLLAGLESQQDLISRLFESQLSNSN